MSPDKEANDWKDADEHKATGDYYLNEQGLVTFTAAYLLRRGYCCGNGCLHCPYNYEAVPEPKRTLLLERRQPK
jgi:hypothetical protein